MTFLFFGCELETKPTINSYQNSSFKTPAELYPDLFKAVQMGEVFPDSKTFVDCTAKNEAKEINRAFANLASNNKEDLMTFVEANFDIPPLISSDFKSDSTKTAAEHVESLWPVLKRASDKSVSGSTLIPLPKPYIVPGGRFREVYYWDSYFTMLGLVESGELELIENMLDNFSYLIETIGHIPNGNRVYYKTRSQPPFFSQMVKVLAEVKGDEVYKKYYDALKSEYEFWMRRNVEKGEFEHTVDSPIGVVNRYYDAGDKPRQESYREDYELTEAENGGPTMYRHLRSGAESGWDYSSRWFYDLKNISTIRTTDIVPVDLNALLYGLEEILIEHGSDENFQEELKKSQQVRKEYLEKYCVAGDGTYEDYNWREGRTTKVKSLAMIYPLFFKMVDQERADKIAKYVKDNFLKPGGVVTSIHNTGQQWDAPNGWAPLQWMTIIGLENYGHSAMAQEIAQRWTSLNEKVYKNTGKFVEKYNVEDLSLEAGGGEYPVQDGFGWSNGVYLALKSYLKSER